MRATLGSLFVYPEAVSQTFAEENQFRVAYDGDVIESTVYTDHHEHRSVLDFLDAYDSNAVQARQEAIQCYINLYGDPNE